jgi:phage antirepressor YoqD-like protein
MEVEGDPKPPESMDFFQDPVGDATRTETEGPVDTPMGDVEEAGSNYVGNETSDLAATKIKADFLDHMHAIGTLFDFEHCTRMMGFPEVDRSCLFEILRTEGVLFSETHRKNQLQQWAVDEGRFKTVFTDYMEDGQRVIYRQPMATISGVLYMVDLLRRLGFQQYTGDPESTGDAESGTETAGPS